MSIRGIARMKKTSWSCNFHRVACFFALVNFCQTKLSIVNVGRVDADEEKIRSTHNWCNQHNYRQLRKMSLILTYKQNVIFCEYHCITWRFNFSVSLDNLLTKWKKKTEKDSNKKKKGNVNERCSIIKLCFLDRCQHMNR